MKMRHFFSVDIHIFLFKNTHLLFLLFVCFLFCLKTLLYVSAYCFLGEGKKLCVSDRVPRFFISLCNYKRQHSWPPTFCRQIWAVLFLLWTCQIIYKFQKQLVQLGTQNDSDIGKEFMSIDFVDVQNKIKILFWNSIETSNKSTYFYIFQIHSLLSPF